MLSEVIDKMTDISVNLCHAMQLPQREYVQMGGASGKITDHEDSQSPGLSSSPGICMYIDMHLYMVVA